MPFAARLITSGSISRLTALLLLAGFNGAFALNLQAQVAPEAPSYDPDTDPRIDRRPHPNAPRSSAPTSLLHLGVKPTGPIENENPVFLAFAIWIQKYRLAPETQKTELVIEGINLAKTRRIALLELIINNPQRALEWAVSYENRALLPDTILAHLETRVAGCGALDVIVSLSRPSSNPGRPQRTGQTNTPKARTGGSLTDYLNSDARDKTLTRKARISGKSYDAYVYGWRRSLTTKYNIPLQGIAVDTALALDVNPARVLENDEMPPAGAIIGNAGRKCPLCGGDFSAETGIVAQIGSVFYFFDSRAHLEQVAEKIIQGQLQNGPKAGSTCDQPLTALFEEVKQNELIKAGIGAGNNGVAVGDF